MTFTQHEYRIVYEANGRVHHKNLGPVTQAGALRAVKAFPISPKRLQKRPLHRWKDA